MGKQIYLSKLTRRFRVVLEESWQGELASNPDRRWYEIIPCQGFKKGPGQEGSFIGLFSEVPPTLCLYSNRPITAKKIWQAIKNYLGCRADLPLMEKQSYFFRRPVWNKLRRWPAAEKNGFSPKSNAPL